MRQQGVLYSGVADEGDVTSVVRDETTQRAFIARVRVG